MNKIRVIRNITSTFYQHGGVRYQRVGTSTQCVGLLLTKGTRRPFGVKWWRCFISMISNISLIKSPHINNLTAVSLSINFTDFQPLFTNIWTSMGVLPRVAFGRTHPLASYNWDWEVIIRTMVTAYNITVSVRSGVFRHNRDSVGTHGLYRHNKTSLLA